MPTAFRDGKIFIIISAQVGPRDALLDGYISPNFGIKQLNIIGDIKLPGNVQIDFPLSTSHARGQVIQMTKATFLIKTIHLGQIPNNDHGIMEFSNTSIIFITFYILKSLNHSWKPFLQHSVALLKRVRRNNRQERK